MKIGTKTVLFGYHQFLLHPAIVMLAWWKLYGFPRDPRLWVAFVVHDLGYWGKRNLDGTEPGGGEDHVQLGARIMGRMFDYKQGEDKGTWYQFCLYHSRFIAARYGMPPSRLCMADKYAVALYPRLLYLGLTWMTGELGEYLASGKDPGHVDRTSGWKFITTLQIYMRNYVKTHKDEGWTPGSKAPSLNRDNLSPRPGTSGGSEKGSGPVPDRGE